MRHIITGQSLLIVCCLFYMIWWYRGFKPNIEADRLGGLNGVLLLITAILGIAGILFSLHHKYGIVRRLLPHGGQCGFL